MNRLIVSFTSFPARIDSVKTVLDSLYQQTRQADEIILWLAEDQFPQGEADLPTALQEDLEAQKFTLRWCDDLGSHKKYFYVMQEYPEDIIVTVDDDLYYHPDSLEKLMNAHERYPHAVVALTTSLVQLDENLHPLPIAQWLFDFQQLREPSMLLMAGTGGGTLFPPGSIDQRIFDKQLVYDTCSGFGRVFADDLLLKAGEMLKHTPVLSVSSKTYYRLPKTQETSLASILPAEEHNNQSLKKIEERFSDEFNVNDRLVFEEAVNAFRQSEQYDECIKKYWLERPSRELERQVGFSSLSGNLSKLDKTDHRKIKDTVRLAARVFTVYNAGSYDDETAKAVRDFQQQLLNIPDIDSLAESDAVAYGFVKYGVPLNTECHILYRGNPIYMKSLKNWQSFMGTHPNCEPIFRKGYEEFLKETRIHINESGSILTKAEIDEWKSEYNKAIKAYAEATGQNMILQRIKWRIASYFKN